MPHTARRKSASGYYHVVPKGVASLLLFEDDEDRRRYLRLLSEAKERYRVRIHAYCLMSNHVHLVLEDVDDKLSELLKYVHERYATDYARRIGRSGGVFRKPCWSEAIETEPYLLSAIRYVHANPLAAGLCMASAYEWSSAKDYLGRKGVADTDMVLDMLGGRDGFISFSQARNNTALPFPGSRLRGHMTDDEAAVIASGLLGPNRFAALSQMKDSEKVEVVRLLIEHGFTQQQIARIIGVSRSYIQKVSS